MKRPSAVRLGPIIAMGLLGFAIVAAGTNTDPRASRRARLVDLIQREDDRSRTLREQVDLLQQQIIRLEAQAGKGKSKIAAARTQLERLGVFAGTSPVQGPGVQVELRDSKLREAPTGNPNDLVIHEQDLQAVVNALWGAGAEALAINGQRITSASAVRCVGNTLLLHGSVYAPPYRIAAIGSVADLEAGLLADPLVERFRILAEDLQLGFDVTRAARLRLGAFSGVLPR